MSFLGSLGASFEGEKGGNERGNDGLLIGKKKEGDRAFNRPNGERDRRRYFPMRLRNQREEGDDMTSPLPDKWGPDAARQEEKKQGR